MKFNIREVSQKIITGIFVTITAWAIYKIFTTEDNDFLSALGWIYFIFMYFAYRREMKINEKGREIVLEMYEQYEKFCRSISKFVGIKFEADTNDKKKDKKK